MKREGRIMKKNKKRRNTEHRKTMIPLLLAAIYSNSHITRTLIKKCLSNILRSLHDVDLSPLLALLPSLLKCNCEEIVCQSAEIIGAASVASFDMNEKIALEDEIVKGLISLLGNSKRDIALTCCNALLDLSTTLVGRQRLIEFNAIETIILCFIQECTSPTVYPDLKFLEKDEYQILLLQGAIALINSCTIKQLDHIPVELSEKISTLLKRIWGQAHKKRLDDTSSNRDTRDEFCISNIRTNNVVESIFRLSINSRSVDFDHVEKSTFYLEEVGVRSFLSEFWETSPMFIRNKSKTSLRHNNIFSPFTRFLGLIETIPTNFLSTFLKRIISCHAIASDELDILQVIKEIKSDLGRPIIYHQDIRVVKTEYGERELHYFHEQSYSTFLPDTHILSSSDMLKCEEAFKEGYSIALRGIEFRDQTIASFADGLASLFGQPSAGVNMYLTPPSNSQGLARHSDDHCVFVCQLIGVKRWKVFTRPHFQLPRLYESCDGLHDSEDESREFDGCRQFVLREGDVLYIPRGFPHEAATDADDFDNVKNGAEFSLHLTVAVEIESPFEWEGFMHIAVDCWAKTHYALQYKSGDIIQRNLHLASTMLLHIAIKLIGHRDLRFRKACLVGSIPFSPDTRDWLCENQKTTFGYLISTIMSESEFADIVKHVEAALELSEDPLRHVSWLKHIEEDEEELERSTSFSRDLFEVLSQHKDMAKAAFLQVKSRFCREVDFDDVKRRYQQLLEKYRRLRKQYTNGMLAVHSALHDAHVSHPNT